MSPSHFYFKSPTDFSFEVCLSKLELKTKKVAMNKITSILAEIRF